MGSSDFPQTKRLSQGSPENVKAFEGYPAAKLAQAPAPMTGISSSQRNSMPLPTVAYGVPGAPLPWSCTAPDMFRLKA